jgi:hypothetical protein
MVLNWRNRANVAIVITTAAIADIVSGAIITGGAIIAIGSIVGVPTVVSVVVFIR